MSENADFPEILTIQIWPSRRKRRTTAMSTRLGFDLDGLRRAIESGDAPYRTALYADTAELRIVDSDQPAQPPQILHGRSAIAGWIESMYGADDTHRVLESAADGEQIRVVEVRETTDGLHLVYATAAEVDRGQIIRETAILTQHRTAPKHHPGGIGTGSDDTPVMIDQGPGSMPHPPPHSPAPATTAPRHVPGYYLG